MKTALSQQLDALEAHTATLRGFFAKYPQVAGLNPHLCGIWPDNLNRPGMIFSKERTPALGELFGTDGWERAANGRHYRWQKTVEGVDLIIPEAERLPEQPLVSAVTSQWVTPWMSQKECPRMNCGAFYSTFSSSWIP